MFEAAELGQKVDKAEYRKRVPILRRDLLDAQRRLVTGSFPVILLFGGVDKGGKGESANLLTYWMDARRLVTHAYDEPTQEERERPDAWRYWRDLPRKGHIGVFLSAWYSRPFLDHVYERCSTDHFNVELEQIQAFERTLADNGALIVKIWMHLGKEAQRRRFDALEADPLQSWRVKQQDWQHLEMYDRFATSAEHMIMRTSVGSAPWTIVEGEDPRYRNLRVAGIVLEALERRFEQDDRVRRARKAARKKVRRDKSAHMDVHGERGHDGAATPASATVLDRLDMRKRVDKEEYRLRLKGLQGRLHRLRLEARKQNLSTILVFEGWDAAGKGGAIRRLIAALDARRVQVISIAAPTDEEGAHHYLWRFWRHLPRAGRVTIFDRSWYGRVLVERVEGFATEREWRRAYGEINDFERQLVDHGDIVVKFWLHVTRKEQEARFRARARTPHKQWKLTDEDWRNRERWDDYVRAVNEMVERTSTYKAPWHLIAANDKRYARLQVLQEAVQALETRLGVPTPSGAAEDAAVPSTPVTGE